MTIPSPAWSQAGEMQRGRSRLFSTNGGTLVSIDTTEPAAVRVARVQVGIDAAMLADHHVTIRETTQDGQVHLSRFHAPPTIAGVDSPG